MIEAPLEIQKNLTIPENHIDVCRAAGVAYRGNAAGNTVDYLDIQGQNKMPAPLPAGFTARGIVALVFSCVSALLGVGVIAWYVETAHCPIQPDKDHKGSVLTILVLGTEQLRSPLQS